MKLSRKPCRIVGVRAGEVSANLLAPAAASVSAKFFLLGEDGQSYGSHTKERGWSEKTVEAFRNFIESMESDVVLAMFDDDSESTVTSPPSGLSFPSVPTLGGTKRNDPP